MTDTDIIEEFKKRIEERESRFEKEHKEFKPDKEFLDYQYGDCDKDTNND